MKGDGSAVHAERYRQYYESGVLNPDDHARLVGEIESIAREANVPAMMIYTPMDRFCSAEEIEWVRDLRKHQAEGVGGLAYIGKCPEVELRMMAIAGACLRNYVEARVMTVQDVLMRIKKEKRLDHTVLLIPNFFLGKTNGGQIASWEVASLLGVLYSRLSAGKTTILYVENLDLLKSEYGASFYDHIVSRFYKISQ